ncbi:hypothetical protein EK904_014212 [Melospiza melodia maxima]|nr:hypothetical protein EK904_014212 [Melospiza melodia maxima]
MADSRVGDAPSLGLVSREAAMASWALGAILTVLASLIIAANVLVAIILLCHIRKRGSKGLCFVLNLALADAMVGFTVMGLALVTGPRVGLCLVGLWLFAAIIGFLPVFIPYFQRISNHWKCSFFNLFQPSYMLTMFCLGFFPALFLFLYLYCDMLKIASVHVQHIQEVEQAGLGGGCPPPRATSDMKAMRTVAVLIGCFTLSWLPFFICSIVQMACPECFPYKVIENFLWLLGLGNSLLNPLLYSYWQKDVQFQLSQLAAGVKRRVLLHLGNGHCFLGRNTKAPPAVSCLELQD